jgi:hypothetical protein
MKSGKLGRAIGAVAAALLLGALSPAAAMATSIAGTVTDQETHAPIAGVEVCAHPQPYTFEDICAKTAADGTYQMNVRAASYQVHFQAWQDGLNYVDEWYDESPLYPGNPVTVSEGEAVSGIDAELEAGGVITGAAVDSSTLDPAVGAWVCVEDEAVQAGFCTPTDSNGEYEVHSLPTGEYRIEFYGANDANYLRRFYDEAEESSGATRVPLAAGETVSGIDATLDPGGQIQGTVTEAGVGTPLAGVEVCLYEYLRVPSPEYVYHCDWTDSDGGYAIRSLAAESFKVVFSQEGGGPFRDEWVEQWWTGVSSAAEAAPLTVTPPDTITGIDAQLVSFAAEEPQVGGSAVGPVDAMPSQVVRQPLRKCKKGFHRKLVKGKKRCVRKHRHHLRRRR